MKLGILGCGQMGENILKGLLARDAIDPASTVLTTKFDDHLEELSGRYPTMTVTKDNEVAASRCDLLLLAVHPDAAQEVLNPLVPLLRGKMVVSICAGLTTARLRKIVGTGVDLVRAMPNTPVMIGEGIVVICAEQMTDKGKLARVCALFEALGLCMVMDEKYMDTVTALASAGPAFAFVIIEALADGAVMMGLPRKLASQLTSQMLQGAARLQLETGEHPAALKDQVTTPGGITTAGLLVMEEGGIRSTLARTIQTASSKAHRLGED